MYIRRGEEPAHGRVARIWATSWSYITRVTTFTALFKHDTGFELEETQCNRLASVSQGIQGLTSLPRGLEEPVEMRNLPRSGKAPWELKEEKEEIYQPESRAETTVRYQRMTKESHYGQALPYS